jgi:transposase
MLPVGRRKVELVVNIQRLYCKDCGTIRQSNLAFADPKKHYTRLLERFVVDLCRIMSIQDASELTDLGWEETPSAVVSMYESRPGCNGIECLDSRSILQRDQNTQRCSPEVIGMEAIYPKLAQTPYQHRKAGSDQQ